MVEYQTINIANFDGVLHTSVETFLNHEAADGWRLVHGQFVNSGRQYQGVMSREKDSETPRPSMTNLPEAG